MLCTDLKDITFGIGRQLRMPAEIIIAYPAQVNTVHYQYHTQLTIPLAALVA